MKKTIAQTCLSAMALAITASSAWAQAPAMQVQAGISSMSYSLVDLDTADGVAAGIVFQPLQTVPGTVMVAELASNQSQANVVEGTAPFNLFAGANYSLALPSGRSSVVVGNDSVSAYSQLSMADLESAVRGDYLFPNSTGSYGMSSYATSAAAANLIEPLDSANPDFAQLSNFILSPHTRLVLEGTFDAQTFFDRDSIDPALLASVSSAPDSALYFDLSGETSLIAYLQNDPYQTAEHYVYKSLAFDTSGWWRDEGSAQESVSFQLVLTNDSDDYKSGAMRYFAMTNAMVTLEAPLVPEPATWATFALGLGFLGAAVARQRNHAV